MAKAAEAKVITQADTPDISKKLMERLDQYEKDEVLSIFIQKEIRQKLAELDKKGKEVHSTLEEYVKLVEKRLLNRIVLQEVKAKVMGSRI